MRGKRAATTEQELAEFCVSADFHCDQPLCHREILYKTLLGVVRPRIVPFLGRFFGIKELLYLANIVSVGENQLHHVIRMVGNSRRESAWVLSRSRSRTRSSGIW